MYILERERERESEKEREKEEEEPEEEEERRPVIGSAGYFARGAKRDVEFWCIILTY